MTSRPSSASCYREPLPGTVEASGASRGCEAPLQVTGSNFLAPLKLPVKRLREKLNESHRGVIAPAPLKRRVGGHLRRNSQCHRGTISPAPLKQARSSGVCDGWAAVSPGSNSPAPLKLEDLHLPASHRRVSPGDHSPAPLKMVDAVPQAQQDASRHRGAISPAPLKLRREGITPGTQGEVTGDSHPRLC